jgi:UDP-glucose 4-epimerase
MAGTTIITGGAGFIGSHVVDAVLANGRTAVVIDDLSSGSSHRVAADAHLEQIDIVDRAELDRVFDAARPDAVFHLAAQSSVTVSVKDPGRDCAVNVHGTLNVLEAAKRHGAPVVFTSTGGALYGNDAPIPTDEARIPAPLAPYGASKWAGEAYLTTWARSSGLPHAVCRLGNVYGPRQSPHGEAGVISIFSHKLWRREAPVVFGHGQPTRDYIHVHDVVAAMLKASGVVGVFNVATGIETDVASLLAMLQVAAGTHIEPRLAPLRDGELERSCMDPSKARRELGWNAEIALDRGVVDTYSALIKEFEATTIGS